MNDAETQRVEEILYGVLEVSDAAGRQVFLNDACVGEPSLRTTVEKLLESYSEAEVFFHESSKELAPAIEVLETFTKEHEFSEGVWIEAPIEDAEGQQIGPYKVGRKIGEGGCGVVYQAEQEHPVRRQVALKIIKLGMDTRNVIARFRAEQQVLALMEHPNIAHVLDAGATATGRPYFVMELVRGSKLTDYCDANQLDVRARLELFIQVCHAVQHAHQKGIIHRDLKPSNILVANEGVPVPKVIDFGIAKATAGRLTDNTLFTAVDQFVGTPAYMSPEQVEPSGVDVDTRSDIYSLGVLLYELLTGRTPFEHQQLVNSGLEAMRRTLLETVPRPPSTLLTTLRRDAAMTTAKSRHTESMKLISAVRGDLDWIVLKALEKDRQRRYETVDALALDISRYLNLEAVLARPPSRIYRLRKLVRRNRVAFAAGAAVFVALAVGCGVSTWLFVRERTARMEQVRLRQEAELRQKLTQATVYLSRNQFDQADDLIAGIPAAQAGLEYAAMYRTLGGWHAINNRWQQASERFAVLEQMDQPDFMGNIIMDYLRYGPVLVMAGDKAGYERFRRAAIARYADTTDPVTAERVVKISLLTPGDGQLMRSLQPLADLAEKSLEQSVPPDGVGMAAWRACSLALMKYRQNDYGGAVAMCERAHSYHFINAAMKVTIDLVLAMARYRLDQTDAARTALVDSRAAMQNLHDDSPYYYWFDSLFANVLLDEAAALING